MKQTNANIARGLAATIPTDASWAAFDALPRSVRQIIWDAPLPINPVDVAKLLVLAEVNEVIVSLRSAIGREIALFATEHRRRFGYDLPHMAAGVTLQRRSSSIERDGPRSSVIPRIGGLHATPE